MKKIKFGMIVLVVAALLLAAAHAESNKQAQPRKARQKAAQVQLKNKTKPAISELRITPVSIPRTTPLEGPRQGYRMVTDVLDSFGGESESDNYKIPVNSGGQPPAIGISQDSIYVVKAGFVLASDVKHGDANSDRVVGPGDVVYLINYLYRGGPEPCPMEAGDANCDGVVGPGDIVYLLNFLYRGGPPPVC